MKHPRVVIGQTPCGFCQKPVYKLKDFDYIDPDGKCQAFTYERAVLCDKADDDGCFLIYHDHCFAYHTCPVHEPKK